MHESIKMNAFGALWGTGERRTARQEVEESERWHSLKKREGEEGQGRKGGKEEQSALLNGNWLSH